MISRKSHLENQTIKGIMYLQTKVLMCENVHPLQELLSIPKYIQKKNEKNNNKERKIFKYSLYPQVIQSNHERNSPFLNIELEKLLEDLFPNKTTVIECSEDILINISARWPT